MNNEPITPGMSEAAREILAYLSEHPNARDTLEGIAEWWLLHQKIYQQASLVTEALSTLVRDGLLRVDNGPGDARPVYRLNRPAQEKAI